MKKLFFIQLLCVFALASVSAQPKVQKVNPWPMDELMKAPDYEMGDIENDVKEIVYESIDYRGNKKKVFAYYASPGTLTFDESLDENLPAVVCVHGGGGRAFADWVKIWAKRGYAAIAMDLYGKSADNTVQLEGGYQKQKGTFVSTLEDQNEDWFFNAVADVVAAHSLLLNLDGIDPERTAVVGVSWGGIITTLVSGLDPRFKVAAPIYGCGYLYQTGSMAPQIKADGERTIQRWTTQYDPALYQADSKIPVLFVNGTNDTHFYTNQWNETVALNKKAERSMKVGLKHGHKVGWRATEVYSFVDYHLGVGEEQVVSTKFTKLKFSKDIFSATLKDAPKSAKAYLNFTTFDEVNHKAQWEKTEIKYNSAALSSKIDAAATQWYLSVEYPTGENYSSEIYFRGGDKLW